MAQQTRVLGVTKEQFVDITNAIVIVNNRTNALNDALATDGDIDLVPAEYTEAFETLFNGLIGNDVLELILEWIGDDEEVPLWNSKPIEDAGDLYDYIIETLGITEKKAA